MIQARLNDAAIVLYQVLDQAGIKHGIFGGYAIGSLGGPRESKDIDCIASVTKDEIIRLLDGRHGFQFVNQPRPDYVAFVWSDTSDKRNAVLVEIFVERFEGAQFGLQNVQTRSVQVSGQVKGSGSIAILDPVYIFKGKLRAAATRGKYHDSADLRFLEGRYLNRLREKRNQFNLRYIGLAMKRYPELELVFNRIEVDTRAAQAQVATEDLRRLPAPRHGDVQRGILA